MSVVMTEQAFQTGVLLQAHMYGHMVRKNIYLHVAYYNRRRISTLLAGVIRDTFAVSH